ncbi:metal ion efflux pump, RND family, membrane fusion protein [Syntrophotalea carbinolica DSM 2380]|uniref:Metal ion efflux pump, RND family, membrane fusion protein n=1 Tax=Syntrophotalea carbinolica (strain DSM 2380 / NBRC 103641 / GraBd1) TaxID=338963 RepID=Q3A3U9_SYNC1|nr:efflux RND transporter periplasmic adaptor subunit [Syntrophotalea carbinolica]ABA88958.1 metal ion efflux pump, RND family, membrane fusion protein [Syntrophotalea carbinolica DSM 2380]
MTPLKKRFFFILLFVFLSVGGVWYGVHRAGSLAEHASHDVEGTQIARQQYTCGMHPMIITDEPGDCPICGMALTPVKSGTTGQMQAADVPQGDKPKGERKIKYWVAPMDPTYIRDEPGKSPMGMDLVPVYEDQAPSGATIAIDPVTAQNMGVRTASAERRHMHRKIRTVGTIKYDEPKVTSINAKVDGWIERLYVDETGQMVKNGQPLLALYSPKLVSAQQEYLLALRNRDALKNSSFEEIAAGGDRLLTAARQRLRYWDISERQISRLEKTGKVHKTLTLYAPSKGVVTMKMAMPGQFIKAGQELFQISDISKVWVYADIYEYELPWIETGQEAEVILPFVGGQSLKANIDYIYPYVEPQTRTVKARIVFDNPGLELKPDMYVNVRIHGMEVKDALAVPSEAVLNSGEKQTVFVALGDGKFEPRQVKTGVQDQEGFTEITQGLLEGETVVTSAQFLFDSESKLREAIQKMLEPKTTESSPSEDHAGHDMPEEDLEALFE